jgi:hypothetical protein
VIQPLCLLSRAAVCPSLGSDFKECIEETGFRDSRCARVTWADVLRQSGIVYSGCLNLKLRASRSGLSLLLNLKEGLVVYAYSDTFVFNLSSFWVELKKFFLLV